MDNKFLRDLASPDPFVPVATLKSPPTEAAEPLEARLAPPPRRRGVVARPRLTTALRGFTEARLVLVSAPAGYGKTTLVAEWARKDRRPVAWLSVAPADDDPVTLVQDVAFALERVQPVSTALFDALRGGRGALVPAALPRLGKVLAERSEPLILVLDDAQRISSRAALDVLRTVIDHLPDGSHVVLATRSPPALPLARMRAQGTLAEIHASSLRMTPSEGTELLRAAGAHVDALVAEHLVERTEGWPAALYLAALSLREAPGPADAAAVLAGDDRSVADYLRDEVLSQVSPEFVGFLTRTSILDLLSGPVCDAVLETDDSAGLLRHLSDASLFISPVDRSQEWFHLHQLFREMLAAELHREEPALEPELQRRASSWFEQHGDSERAIRHALSAGDTAHAADLVWLNTPLHQSQGHAGTLTRWLQWFSREEIAAHPALAITAAVACIDAGDGDGARDWASIAEASPDRSPLADDSSLQGLVALVRAALAGEGVVRMREDAARARDLLPDGSPWTAVACYLEGVAMHLAGDRQGSRARLEEAARRSGSALAGPHALALAQLALLAKANGDWDEAAALVRRARALQRRHGIEDYASHAIVFATSANVLANSGDAAAARTEAQRAAGLLAQLQGEGPWMAVEARIVLARAALRLGDSVTPRTLLSEAEHAFKLTPDAIVLRERLDETWEWVQSIAVQLPGVSPLTTAELRVLQHLPTHLSFREIGERIHVSQNTVKTQALAVYRKLDVASRSEAVDRARELGLITS